MNTELPKFNLALHNEIIAEIEANPDGWEQSSWHCGTAHCYGGWAQIKVGHKPDKETARRDARIALGLTDYEARIAFCESNSLEFLKNIPEYFKLNGAGYNSDGYDRDGYDRDGRDRYGRNREGYDRAGYNRYGRDRSGYDRDGLDKFNNRKPA